MQVVVYILTLWKSGVICAVAQTQHHLEIRHVHTSRQLPTPVSSLEEEKKKQNKSIVNFTTEGFLYLFLLSFQSENT